MCMLRRIRDRSVDCDLKGQDESELFWPSHGESPDIAADEEVAESVEELFLLMFEPI